MKSVEALVTLVEKLSDSKEDERCQCGCLYIFHSETIKGQNSTVRVKECLNDSCKNFKMITIVGPDES